MGARYGAALARGLMHIKERRAPSPYSMPMDEQAVTDALRAVEDPEAGMSIVDLGLVYGVEVGPAGVRVRLTMTSPACPAAPYLVDESVAAIRAVAPPGTDVQVELVWDPPWTPDRMSAEARGRFGWAD